MKTNIMFVIDKMPIGGAERQLFELLKGIDKERYNPSLVYFSECPGFMDDVRKLDIPVFLAERKWRWDPLVIWKLFRLIRRHRIALIHTHLPLAGIYGSVSAWLSGVPIVNSSIREARRPTLYEKTLLRISFALSNVIVANSEAGRRVYGKLSPRKAVVIHNGIDLKRFCKLENRQEKIKELNLERFNHIVSMVTRLEPIKNPMMIIKTAAIVLKTEPNTAFLIIGDGSLKKNLEMALRREGLDTNVFLLGFRKDVEEILQITDVGVLTSNSEGLPNAVIEMLASAVPVVATDCDGTREVLDDGQTGYFVKIDDVNSAAHCIVTLLKDEVLRRTMGERGKEELFKKLSLNKMVDALDSIYCELLEPKPKGGDATKGCE